jgi:hypothetical protein
MLERLSRAAEEMARESERSGSEDARRAAEELSRAAEQLSRGEREAAREALERAAEAAQALEREREEMAREAEAIARLLEASGLLERAMQLAMMGRGEGEDAGEGEGAGERGMGQSGAGENGESGEAAGEGAGTSAEMAALRRALAERLAAMGESQPGGSPDVSRGGSHIPDHPGAARDEIGTSGDVHARSQVGEGERAVAAVRGLGKNAEPTRAFRDVFPHYDAMAEEAIGDDAIPAARRDAVRQYFESIRPGGGEAAEEE